MQECLNVRHAYRPAALMLPAEDFNWVMEVGQRQKWINSQRIHQVASR